MIIGTFHRNQTSDSFFGTITTLAGTVPVDVFPIFSIAKPKAPADSLDQQPDYTVSVHGIEIGCGWRCPEKGDPTVFLEIDSPVLAAPCTCLLVSDDTGKTFSLNWSRERGGPT